MIKLHVCSISLFSEHRDSVIATPNSRSRRSSIQKTQDKIRNILRLQADSGTEVEESGSEYSIKDDDEESDMSVDVIPPMPGRERKSLMLMKRANDNATIGDNAAGSAENGDNAASITMGDCDESAEKGNDAASAAHTNHSQSAGSGDHAGSATDTNDSESVADADLAESAANSSDHAESGVSDHIDDNGGSIANGGVDIGNDDVDQIVNQDHNEGGNEHQRGRKRKRNEMLWKKNINKRMRNKGKGYQSKNKHGQLKLRVPRKMGPGCGIGCNSKCHEKISNRDRDRVFEGFWHLANVDRQRDFISRHIKCTKAKRQTTHRRKHSFEYNLEIRGSKFRVCKTFFLHTLAISKTVVENTMKKKTDVATVLTDRRGKHMKQRKISDDVRANIRQHIQMFPTVPAHYVRKDSNRKYLEGNLSITKMYSLYQEWCIENGYTMAKKWLYDQIFIMSLILLFSPPKRISVTYV